MPMRVKIETTADVYVELSASGNYARDVMDDLCNRARELFTAAVQTCDDRLDTEPADAEDDEDTDQ